MSDRHAYINVVAEISLGYILFINFQPYIIIDIVSFLQLDRKLVICLLALHESESERRIVIEVGRICRHIPADIVLVIQLNQPNRISAFAFCIHFNHIIICIERNLCYVII